MSSQQHRGLHEHATDKIYLSSLAFRCIAGWQEWICLRWRWFRNVLLRFWGCFEVGGERWGIVCTRGLSDMAFRRFAYPFEYQRPSTKIPEILCHNGNRYIFSVHPPISARVYSKALPIEPRLQVSISMSISPGQEFNSLPRGCQWKLPQFPNFSIIRLGMRTKMGIIHPDFFNSTFTSKPWWGPVHNAGRRIEACPRHTWEVVQDGLGLLGLRDWEAASKTTKPTKMSNTPLIHH